MAKGKRGDVLYRAVKFEIHPDERQIAVLRKVSDNLALVWNEALEERQKTFDEFVAPLYERLKEAGAKNDEDTVTELRKELKAAFKEHRVSLFDQINALTSRRNEEHSAFGQVPRNWQEETLDTLEGGFKSFLALRKNADPHARPPGMRSEWHFCEISGRYGFKILEGKEVRLSCGAVSGETGFTFPIPSLQRELLLRAIAVKKFTLYRDERDLRKPGRFWISLAFEIKKPETKKFVPEEAVYVSLGASFLGVVSPNGEETISLWRSDKHWKPEADAVEDRVKRCKEGSRAWKRRNGARRKMLRIMSRQQKQDRREIVANDLLRHGVHFVVSDLVVRSKRGRLADASKPERRGQLGLNWSAQNTGSIGYLVLWLEEKAKEHGGTVRKHRLFSTVPDGSGYENKIPMARLLREDFLKSVQPAA